STGVYARWLIGLAVPCEPNARNGTARRGLRALPTNARRDARARKPNCPQALCCALALLFAFHLLGSASAADWEAGQGFRARLLDVPSAGRTGFQVLPPSETGIFFTNLL